jgi:hypothetical protein
MRGACAAACVVHGPAAATAASAIQRSERCVMAY